MPKITKAYAITNAKISFVSLVDKAANKKQFLITKSDDSATMVAYSFWMAAGYRFSFELLDVFALSCSIVSFIALTINGVSFSPILSAWVL
jgi:hypothetical protein